MLPQLAVFEAAARLGSYTRAAEALHLAQPTVSTQLKKLSETLQLTLFEQIGKRVHLTPAGRALYAGCSDLFASLARIEDGLASLRDLDSGRLRVAVCSSAKYFAPRLLAAFARRHPKIEIALHADNRAGLLARLAENADDLYVFTHAPTDQEVVTQAILANPLVVLARADHPFAGERRVPVTVLAEEALLVREQGSGTRMAADDVFARHGIAQRVRMELSTNEAIRQAILAGLGIAILPRHTYGLEAAHDQLVELDIEGFPLERQWQFVYPVGKHVSAITRAFMDYVRLEAGALAADRPAQGRVPAAEARAGLRGRAGAIPPP
jgi:DNA-binding transcriptional LysR family regulator